MLPCFLPACVRLASVSSPALVTYLLSGKSLTFPDGNSVGEWYSTNDDPAGAEEKARILTAVRLCAQKREGVSLFTSAIESEKLAMISAVAEGIRALVPEHMVRKAACKVQHVIVINGCRVSRQQPRGYSKKPANVFLGSVRTFTQL